MKLIPFISLLPAGSTKALELAAKEASKPQREGTILLEFLQLEHKVAELAGSANDLNATGEERTRAAEAFVGVDSALSWMRSDLQTDPGGYLVWFWAEGNQDLLRAVSRYVQ